MKAREGDNCWRIAKADRFAFLIDAYAYFETLATTLESARHSVMLIGWDVHSRVQLRRDDAGPSSELAAILDRIVRRNETLEVHVLGWDFSVIYALEREFLPAYRIDWRTHERVHVQLDGHHPTGASHHQKIVVIDGVLAFTGGLDLTMRRWDTPAHEPNDDRRIDPHGTEYEPFHDVQCVFDGEAAAALGELSRERWRRATGQDLPASKGSTRIWPEGLDAAMTDVRVGIARTEPAFGELDEVREIERMYGDAIAGARRSIYIENQYLSSHAVGTALEESLRRADGPEIVVVLPRTSTGWLETHSVGLLRARLIQSLRDADANGRLSVWYPTRTGLGGGQIKVHSKVCVVDDEFVTVGSANLSNRSMGLDTECNVFIEFDTADDERIRAPIATFRNRLLGEHLGVDAERVRKTVEGCGSFVGAIEELRGGERSLEPLRDEPAERDAVSSAAPLMDPEKPIEASELVKLFLGAPSESLPEPRSKGLLVATLGFAGLLGLAAAWYLTPLADWASPERIARWIDVYRASKLAWPATLVLYVVAGLVFLPVTLLIVQTAAVFTPVEAFAHAMIGCLASAAVTYGIGRLLGGRLENVIAGKYVARIGKLLERQGVVSFALVRMLPVAPYSAINLVAGASGVPFGRFLVGTTIGLTPGILALTVVGGQLARVVLEPTWWEWVLLVVLVVGAWGGLFLLQRWARSLGTSRGKRGGQN